MKRMLSASEMKSCDESAIRAGVPSARLMSRAADAVYNELIRGFDTKRVLVVCGSGNNGGDGYLVAARLAEEGGACDILPLGSGDKMSPETAEAAKLAEKNGAVIVSSPDFGAYSCIVDAIFGIGLDREVMGVYAEVIKAINRSRAPVLSVDIPSGVSADSGEVLGSAVYADATVTMAAYKYGLALGEGINRAGRVVCADIGIECEIEKAPYVIEGADLTALPKRRRDSNKGSYGRVLVIGGAPGMCGAAYLAAKAAYRCGAGLCEIFTSEANRSVLQTLLPEAVVTAYKGELPDISLLLASLDRADTVVIGPGLSQSSAARILVRETFKNISVPIICDADSLNVCAADSLAFPESVPVIVTPHPGELSRLCQRSIAELSEDRIGSADTYAAENGVVCVSKFARTVISDAESIFVNMNGSPALSKGGSGDVLTGVIAGMLCCGMSPVGAAAIGVYIHAAAGEKAGERYSEYSPLAGEICDMLPEIMKMAGKEKEID